MMEGKAGEFLGSRIPNGVVKSPGVRSMVLKIRPSQRTKKGSASPNLIVGPVVELGSDQMINNFKIIEIMK